MKGRCPSGKVKFRAEADALDAVLGAKIASGLYGNKRRKECRAYLCPDCTAWHLSSKMPRMSAA